MHQLVRKREFAAYCYPSNNKDQIDNKWMFSIIIVQLNFFTCTKTTMFYFISKNYLNLPRHFLLAKTTIIKCNFKILKHFLRLGDYSYVAREWRTISYFHMHSMFLQWIVTYRNNMLWRQLRKNYLYSGKQLNLPNLIRF